MDVGHVAAQRPERPFGAFGAEPGAQGAVDVAMATYRQGDVVSWDMSYIYSIEFLEYEDGVRQATQQWRPLAPQL